MAEWGLESCPRLLWSRGFSLARCLFHAVLCHRLLAWLYVPVTFFIPMVSSAGLLLGVLSTSHAPTGCPVCSGSWCRGGQEGSLVGQALLAAPRESSCWLSSLCTFLWLIQSDSDCSFMLWPPLGISMLRLCCIHLFYLKYCFVIASKQLHFCIYCRRRAKCGSWSSYWTMCIRCWAIPRSQAHAAGISPSTSPCVVLCVSLWGERAQVHTAALFLECLSQRVSSHLFELSS